MSYSKNSVLRNRPSTLVELWKKGFYGSNLLWPNHSCMYSIRRFQAKCRDVLQSPLTRKRSRLFHFTAGSSRNNGSILRENVTLKNFFNLFHASSKGPLRVTSYSWTSGHPRTRALSSAIFGSSLCYKLRESTIGIG